MPDWADHTRGLSALLAVLCAVAAPGIVAQELPAKPVRLLWAGMLATVALMIAAGLMSAWIPARRALAIAPADALRAE